jgi:alpha-galactosidase
LDQFGVQLLTNDEVIDVDQFGTPGNVVTEGNTSVWAQSLCDGSYNVALFNLNDTESAVSVSWTTLGFSGSATVRDLWAHLSQGSSSDGYSVNLNPHSAALLRIQPQSRPDAPNDGRCR